MAIMGLRCVLREFGFEGENSSRAMHLGSVSNEGIWWRSEIDFKAGFFELRPPIKKHIRFALRSHEVKVTLELVSVLFNVFCICVFLEIF